MLNSATKDQAAQTLYEVYGQDAEWKTFDGRPMPQWTELGEAVQQHWKAVAAHSLWGEVQVSSRESLQIKHAQNYLAEFGEAGVPGSGSFILLGKLANALRL